MTLVNRMNEYQDACLKWRTHPDPNTDLLVKNALGLAGETGELIELIKKHRYHGKSLDREKLKSELGDILWYLTDIATECGLSLVDVAQSNVYKLEARYPNGFVLGGGKR
jgi:NTP pyrophosphatase (non-canonical NTP hydrolase)